MLDTQVTLTVPTKAFGNVRNVTYSNADTLSSYYEVDSNIVADYGTLSGYSSLSSFTVGMWMQADSLSADNGRDQTLFMMDGPTGDSDNQFQLAVDPLSGSVSSL